MKWFKMEGWCGFNNLDEEPGAFPDPQKDWDADGYALHLESIRSKLPTALLDACTALHDAELVSIQTDVHARCTDLMVITSRGHEHWKLEGVKHLRWINNMMGLSGPDGFGHMGYEEIEVDEMGRIVLRILFSTGLELHAVFNDFHSDLDAPPS